MPPSWMSWLHCATVAQAKRPRKRKVRRGGLVLQPEALTTVLFVDCLPWVLKPQTEEVERHTATKYEIGCQKRVQEQDLSTRLQSKAA